MSVSTNLLNDPVHLYLLSGDVLATIAVGFGIVWEHGPPNVREGANKLVIGGVIVETVCSLLLFAYDENISAGLKETNNFLLAQGQETAAFASRARQDAAEANEHAAELEKEAAEAKKDAAEANERSAQLQKDADKARLELAQMEATRVITPSKQQTLAQLLSIAPKGSVSVVYPFTDSTDAKTFADSINQTLEKAGYTLVNAPQRYAGMMAFSAPGAFLSYRRILVTSEVRRQRLELAILPRFRR